ncbi:MAG: hypothetical protein RLW61_05260 [Gammaproteobacteria bacterium]
MTTLHVIPSAARRIAPLAVLAGFAPAALALTVEFDYAYDSSGFFAPGSQARDALEAAGAFFEAAIGDSLGAIESGPGTGGFYTAFLSNPSVFQSGATLRTESIANFSVGADTLRVFVGAVDLDPFSTGTLAVAGPGSYIVNGTTAYRDAMVSRGQGANATQQDIRNIDDETNQTANDFATWGGFMSFDLDRAWHFGIDTPPSGGQPDFLSVALHELAHVFGYGTADSWNNQVFGTSFLGAFSTAANGGTNPSLQSGGSHWSSGLASVVADYDLPYVTNPGATQETALDPTLTLGTRKLMTELDLAGLADIGWEIVEPVTEPPPVTAEQVPFPAAALWLLGAGLALTARRAGSARGQRLVEHLG